MRARRDSRNRNRARSAARGVLLRVGRRRRRLLPFRPLRRAARAPPQSGSKAAGRRAQGSVVSRFVGPDHLNYGSHMVFTCVA